MCEGLGSLPKTQRFVYRSSLVLGGVGRLACRPGCWLVWGGWHAAPDVGWYGAVGMPPRMLGGMGWLVCRPAFCD